MNKSSDLVGDVQLQPHQARVQRAATQEPIRKLLAWQTGAGKSLGALAAAEAQGQPTTVAVPASLRPNYQKEIAKFTDQSTPTQVLSYSALAKGKPVDQIHTLIADESQALRNPDSARTRAVMDLANRAKQVVLLSGTPITNRPGDFAPLMSMLTGKQVSPEEFEARYVTKRPVRPGLLGRLFGVPAGEEEVLHNTKELKSLLDGHIDYFAPDKPIVPTKHEEHVVEMSVPQSRLYSALYGQLPFLTRYKLQKDFPLDKSELQRALSFLTGPRQVGLSTLPFMRAKQPLRAFDQSPKLQRAFELLQAQLKDPRRKAVVYSNFPTAGLEPYAAALQRAGIPAAMFHGGLDDAQRKQMVDDYNSGRIRTALIGPAGSEGISLAGTQLLQILDSHWHSARGRQAEGRGIRFDSHLGLPEDLKNVTIQRFISRLPLGLKDRLLARVGFNRSNKQRAADDFLNQLSARKDKLNNQLLGLIKEVGTPKTAAEEKLAGVIDDLKRAKGYSDQRLWRDKQELLLNLMNRSPMDWRVDQDEGGHVVGLRHRTGFKFHLPRAVVPPRLWQGGLGGQSPTPFAPAPTAL